MSEARSPQAMAGFVVRRLLGSAAILVATLTIVFAVANTLADPVLADLGPFAPEAARVQRGRELGLDQPWLVRLWRQLLAAVTFDFGRSLVFRRPVVAVLRDGVGPTLAYAGPGFLLAAVTAGGAAVISLSYPHMQRAFDTAAAVLLGSSSLVIVTAAYQLLAHHVAWFPLVGWPLTSSSGPETARYLVLPTLLWALLQWGADYRMYLAVFRRERKAPHYAAMVARGLPPSAILRHLLHGSSGTIVARVVQRLPHLLVGSLVIEDLFNIPGIGNAIVVGVRSSDVSLLLGITTILAIVTILVQTIGDLVATWLDPRMRAW